MRDVLFVQGAGERVHDEWDNHLVDSLRSELGAGYHVRVPRMPAEAEPSITSWGPALEAEIATLGPAAVAVGHSVGAGALLHVLAHAARTADLIAVVLIAAPYIGPGGWPSDDIESTAGLVARLPAGLPVLLYHGDADALVPVEHAALYAQVLPRVRVHRLPGRDHQLNNSLAEVAHDIKSLVRVDRRA